MRILIPTIGTRGDVQPFIALAQGLNRAGNLTIVASHPMMRTLVESHGVRFAQIGPDIDLGEEVGAIRQRARNSALGLIQGMRFGFRMLERSHADILALCGDTDLVVVPAAIAAGKNEAELSGLPYLSVSLMPWAIPYDDPERTFFKRGMYKAMDGLVNMITTRPLNSIRQKQGLAPVGKEGFTSTTLNLIPVSPAVFQPNPLWEQHHKLVGYWFADPPGEWEPPDDLLAFLESGDPPVVISLGAMTMGDYDAAVSVNLFVDVIQEVGTRAIFQGWEAEVKQFPLPPSMHASGSIPHSWLLPRCGAIIHHGGFGTTAAGLRAGIPALVIPHLVDQFYWGDCVHELGVGAKPIRWANLEKSTLVESLRHLVQNARLRSAASKLGEQIRAEHGIETAVRLIEGTFS